MVVGGFRQSRPQPRLPHQASPPSMSTASVIRAFKSFARGEALKVKAYLKAPSFLTVADDRGQKTCRDRKIPNYALDDALRGPL